MVDMSARTLSAISTAVARRNGDLARSNVTIDAAVRRARKEGETWRAIADALSVTVAAAHKRYANPTKENRS